MTETVTAGGATIPQMGLGTWRLKGDAVAVAVHAALDAGYRHVDTAVSYGNEAEVGDAVRNHAVGRDAIWVTTKVPPDDARANALQRSAEASLKRLGLDAVDLLLIHWPNPNVALREQIGALVRAKREGFARHIGVSNFPPRWLEAAVAFADEPIVTNQVEHHPYLDQRAMFDLCGRLDVAVTSYCPLGRTALLDDPVVRRIAEERERTPAQIVLRWQVEQPNNVVIPKSGNPGRIAENFAIFDFALTPEESAAITRLARPDGRLVKGPTGLAWDAVPAG
jgi:diketogulonate reductase-like aldo/keto reductase